MLYCFDFAYIQSRLKYGIIFWSRDGDNIKVFRLQEKVIWLITCVHERESCRHIFRKFRIVTLTLLYILEVLSYVKKYQGNLKQNFGIHGYNTRNKLDLHTCYCSTILYRGSVKNVGFKLFNKLPVRIKQLDNYKGFKREMKTFLLNNSLYTIEEFLNFEGI
jgi:hypothetical protein